MKGTTRKNQSIRIRRQEKRSIVRNDSSSLRRRPCSSRRPPTVHYFVCLLYLSLNKRLWIIHWTGARASTDWQVNDSYSRSSRKKTKGKEKSLYHGKWEKSYVLLSSYPSGKLCWPSPTVDFIDPTPTRCVSHPSSHCRLQTLFFF
jgi:hypothetical protein